MTTSLTLLGSTPASLDDQLVLLRDAGFPVGETRRWAFGEVWCEMVLLACATLTHRGREPHTLVREAKGWIFRNNRDPILGHSGHHPTVEAAIAAARAVNGTEVTVL